MSRGVLALDQGSHASRACIFGDSGELCATFTVPVATLHPDAARVEQDAGEVVQSLRMAADGALAIARRNRPHLELIAAGLAVQRSSVVCCSRTDGAALTPIISWQDRRNAVWLQHLAPRQARIRELTGLPLSPHYGASKISWCLEHVPAVMRAATAGDLLAAPLASYLAFRLGAGAGRTDAIPVDAANAARTLLFDSRQLDWSAELLDLFGLQRAWLPRCAPTCGRWGTLHLADGDVELRAVTGDQSAVPFAAGTPDMTVVYVNLGTGAFVQQPLPARPATPAPLLGSVLSCDADRAIYSLEGTVNGAGSAVSWFCSQQGCEESALWPALETLPAATPLPVFVNGVGGLGSPWWRPEQASRFIGAGEILQRFAALVESIAFMIAVNVELLLQKTGSPQRILLAGGMSRSTWLCRRLATLVGLPVEVLDAEASARGVARLAAPECTSQWVAAPSRSWYPEADEGLRTRYQQHREALGSWK